jgi:hypothetical protein
MANPFNPYANSVFARAYLDTTLAGKANAINLMQDPTSALYKQDIGPTEYSASNPSMQGITQPSTDYLAGIFSSPIQQPDILSKGFLPSSETAMQATSLNPAANAAQRAESGAGSLVSAMKSISSLFQGTRPVSSEGLGSADLSKYSNIEKDIRGNIIGLTGRAIVDPYTGRTIGREAKNWQADTGSLGNPYTPGLDAFKAAQGKPTQEESEQSKANREAYLQSRASQLPRGATATQTETPTATQRSVVGPSGYAEAIIPKTQKEREV